MFSVKVWKVNHLQTSYEYKNIDKYRKHRIYPGHWNHIIIAGVYVDLYLFFNNLLSDTASFEIEPKETSNNSFSIYESCYVHSQVYWLKRIIS